MVHSTPITFLRLVLAFLLGLASIWALYLLERPFGFPIGMHIIGQPITITLGFVLFRDERRARELARGFAYLGGLTVGIGTAMSTLHHPAWRPSDSPFMLKYAAPFIVLSLLAWWYDLRTKRRENQP